MTFDDTIPDVIHRVGRGTESTFDLHTITPTDLEEISREMRQLESILNQYQDLDRTKRQLETVLNEHHGQECAIQRTTYGIDQLRRNIASQIDEQKRLCEEQLASIRQIELAISERKTKRSRNAVLLWAMQTARSSLVLGFVWALFAVIGVFKCATTIITNSDYTRHHSRSEKSRL